MITEQVLVDFTKGKKYAFDVIYSSYAAGMYAICLRYTRCEDDAQDVVQEAFIKVYKNQSQYQLTSPIGAWIKSITINTALTFIQKMYKYQLHEDEKVFDELVWEEEPTIEMEELRAKLIQILNKLPEGYRLVFNLFAIENLSHKEIAEYLGISKTPPKHNILRRKNLFRRFLNQKKLQDERARRNKRFIQRQFRWL